MDLKVNKPQDLAPCIQFTFFYDITWRDYFLGVGIDQNLQFMRMKEQRVTSEFPTKL